MVGPLGRGTQASPSFPPSLCHYAPVQEPILSSSNCSDDWKLEITSNFFIVEHPEAMKCKLSIFTYFANRIKFLCEPNRLVSNTVCQQDKVSL
jgi:hypothetical protein